MAFGAKKIFPLDTKPGVGVGVSLPFNAPGVFKTTYTTQESIKYNLINFFLTNQPERYLNPLFGANLRNIIFSQISDGNLNFIESDLRSKLKLTFPDININTFEILKNNDINTIIIKFTYNVINTNLNDEITLSFT